MRLYGTYTGGLILELSLKMCSLTEMLNTVVEHQKYFKSLKSNKKYLSYKT